MVAKYWRSHAKNPLPGIEPGRGWIGNPLFVRLLGQNSCWFGPRRDYPAWTFSVALKKCASRQTNRPLRV